MAANFAATITFLLTRTLTITELSPDDLLKRTDFDYRDTDPTRISSAFAEIRAINFLDEEGFVEIEPLQAKSKRKADFSLREQLESDISFL